MKQRAQKKVRYQQIQVGRSAAIRKWIRELMRQGAGHRKDGSEYSKLFDSPHDAIQLTGNITVDMRHLSVDMKALVIGHLKQKEERALALKSD